MFIARSPTHWKKEFNAEPEAETSRVFADITQGGKTRTSRWSNLKEMSAANPANSAHALESSGVLSPPARPFSARPRSLAIFAGVFRLMASQPLTATEAGAAGGLLAVEPENAAVTPLRIAAAAIVVVAVTVVLFLIRPASVPAQPAAARVAVLPFDTLSDGPAARHFADSLTDEIVTRLNSNRIQVVSRDDAGTLRGSDRDRKVAELGVALLFDGTVQDDGKDVKVRVHLDDAARHVTLWSGSVDGPAASSDQLQASIASTIVAALACSNRALVPAHGLTDPDLLSSYLHACDHFSVNSNRSRQDIYAGLLAALREVTAKAPDFTPAHSDLAKFELYSSYLRYFLPNRLRRCARRQRRRRARPSPWTPNRQTLILPYPGFCRPRTGRDAKNCCGKAWRTIPVGHIPTVFWALCWRGKPKPAPGPPPDIFKRRPQPTCSSTGDL